MHALPIAGALRRRWPRARLAWVVRDSFRQMVEGHRALDEVIVLDTRPGRADRLGAVGFGRLLSRLGREGFDLTIDLQGLLRSGLMTMATSAPRRVGLADAREGARWFYTDTVDASRTELHAVERIKRVARAFGVELDPPAFDLPIAADDLNWAECTLAGLRAPRVVLNLGARWLTKRWPPEHFAEIGRRAVERHGARLIAVGSRDDRPLVDRLAALLAPIEMLDLCGATDLSRLAAVMRQAELVVSNDTGPLHVAAATGVRVIGIYTCTSPLLTGPWGENASTISTAVWCAASQVKTCSRLECMIELSPERVWPAVDEALLGLRSAGAGG